jgi:hypothetical protein
LERRSKLLPYGSCLSQVYLSLRDWQQETDGIVVLVIDYRFEGIEGVEPNYRLATCIFILAIGRFRSLEQAWSR